MLSPSAPRRRRRFMLGMTAILTIAVGVTGCATDADGPATGHPQSTTEPAPEPTPAPEFVPGGSAAENLGYFTHVLTEYSANEGPIEGQPIVDTVTASGFDRQAMQVSFDRTKTNLVADFIFVSVRIADNCLLGQVSSEDRSVTTRVEPAIGPDGTICLIGETRPLDW